MCVLICRCVRDDVVWILQRWKTGKVSVDSSLGHTVVPRLKGVSIWHAGLVLGHISLS